MFIFLRRGWHASGDKAGMNISNAFGFVGVGVMMELLHFIPDITGVREMWLIAMGGVMMFTGGLFLAHAAWLWILPRLITPMLAWVPLVTPAAGRPVPQSRRAAV
jgi:hypothetical protein